MNISSVTDHNSKNCITYTEQCTQYHSPLKPCPSSPGNDKMYKDKKLKIIPVNKLDPSWLMLLVRIMFVVRNKIQKV